MNVITNIFKQMDALDILTEERYDPHYFYTGILTIRGNSSYLKNLKGQRERKLLITFSEPHQHLELFDEILQCGKIENSAVSSQTLLRLF